MKSSVSITMTAAVLAQLRERARAEKRSLSQLLERMAEEHFSPRRPGGRRLPRAARPAATAPALNAPVSTNTPAEPAV